jgi:hypothetical protein
VVNFFKLLPGRVVAFVTNMVNRAVALFQAFNTRARALSLAIFNGVVNFLKNLPANLARIFTDAKNKAVAALTTLLTRAKALGGNIKDGVIKAITGLPGLIKQVFQRALDALTGFASRAFSKARSIGSSLWNGFKDGMGINSPSYIEKAMFQVSKTMGEETKATAKAVKQIQGLGKRLGAENPVSAYSAAGLSPNLTPSVKRAVSSSAASSIASGLPIPRQRTGSGIGTNSSNEGPSNAPLIGTQHIHNPIAEPGSQSAARQARRAALLGGTR